MIYEFDTVAVGLTAAACGLACGGKAGKLLIIDGGTVPAPEYSAAFKSDGAEDTCVCYTSAAESFRRELRERGIIGRGTGAHIPAVAPVTAGRFAASGASFMLHSRITALRVLPDCCELTVFSFGLYHTVRAGAVVDTTALRSTGRFFGLGLPEAEVSRNASVVPPKPGALLPADCVRGRFDDEVYLKVKLSSCELNGDTLEKVCAAAGGLAGWTLLSAASEYDVSPVFKGHTAKALAPRVSWLPSAAFGNAVTAYDAGASCTPAVHTEQKIADAPSSALPAVDLGDFDVIVAGLGTAGAIAAITAAESGLRVLGLEEQLAMGGIGTLGGILGNYYGVNGGLYAGVDEAAAALSAPPLLRKRGHGDISKELVLLRRAEAAGAKLVFGASVTGCLSEGDRVTGVSFSDALGDCTASAAYVIDCTAEGALCVAAGCETFPGRETDGAYQPFSNVVLNYDPAGRLGYVYVDAGVTDQYDPLVFGRDAVISFTSKLHLKEKYTSGTRFVCPVPLLGLREGRKVTGEYTVRFADVISGRVTREPVLWGFSNIDNHGKDNPFEERVCRDWNAVCSMWGFLIEFPVPAGALIPRGKRGLLAAGRLLSVDHVLASALRMKYDMQKSGEAAARLAELAIRDGTDVREVPYPRLREALESTGCIKPQDSYSIVNVLANRTRREYSRGRETLWSTDRAEILAGLAGGEPGYYMMSAYMLGVALKDDLVKLMRSGCPAAALTLGLMDCSEAAPEILRLAADRSGLTFATSRKYNYPVALSAVSLAGRMKLRESVPLLLRMAAERDYTADIPFEPCEFTEDAEDLRFEFALHALRSLADIAEAYPELKPEIRAALRNADTVLTVTSKGSKVERIDYTERVGALIARSFG